MRQIGNLDCGPDGNWFEQKLEEPKPEEPKEEMISVKELEAALARQKELNDEIRAIVEKGEQEFKQPWYKRIFGL